MAENKQYTFHLARWSERDKDVRCPKCGRARGAYKEYLDIYGAAVDVVNHLCGKCDHESSCGYHLTPSEFFKQNHADRKIDVEKIVVKPKARIEIPTSIVSSTMKYYEKNALVSWMKSLPLSQSQRTRLPFVLKLYMVGTSKDGGSIFWQVGSDCKYARTGKKMRYGSDGHRMKDKEGNSIGFNWIHTMMRACPQNTRCEECAKIEKCPFPRTDFDLVQCLFGEHLLALFPNATVHVVESEKTALLMALFDDKFMANIWLATGGKENLNPLRQAPLEGRTVIVYPDKDAVSSWKEKLKDIGIKCRICDAAMTESADEDGEKCDIADIALRRLTMTDEAILDEYKRKNENVKNLIDKFQLQWEKM